jgi:hypothetical protein
MQPFLRRGQFSLAPLLKAGAVYYRVGKKEACLGMFILVSHASVRLSL